MDMNIFENSGQIFAESARELWLNIAAFLPELIAAVFVLIIGLLLASLFGALVRRAIRFARLDSYSEDSGTVKQLREAGLDVTPSHITGFIVRWFFIVVTLVTVADILRLSEVSAFLNEVVLYIPQVLAAVLILVIGIVLGDVLQKLVTAGAQASQVVSGRSVMLGQVTRWAVVLFAIFAALSELGVAEQLIQIVVAGVVLAVALAVGLGSKDRVRQFLDRV